MINFNQLRSFYSIASNQSFTKAAEKLYITQPAVTAQMKAFEESCGFKLFHKQRSHIYLTNEGKILYEYAKKIFEEEKELENAISDIKEVKKGDLRIGSSKTYSKYFMPVMLSQFHKRYPEIVIHLHEGTSQDIIEGLCDFRFDIAVVGTAIMPDRVNFVPFSQDEVVPVVCNKHRLASKSKVTIESLAQEPIIMKEEGSATRKIVDNLFYQSGMKPNILMETGNVEFIKELVKDNYGIAFLVRKDVIDEIDTCKLSIINLQKGNLYLNVSVAYLKDLILSPPTKAFLNTMEDIGLGTEVQEGIDSIMPKFFPKDHPG